MSKLLTEQELDRYITHIFSVIDEFGTGAEARAEITGLVESQKFAHAEMVIGESENHIVVDNGVAIDSCDSYKTANEADCNCPAGERNQLRAEQRKRNSL